MANYKKDKAFSAAAELPTNTNTSPQAVEVPEPYIHIETKMSAVFGVTIQGRNALPRIEVPVSIAEFTEKGFVEAYKAMMKELQKQAAEFQKARAT